MWFRVAKLWGLYYVGVQVVFISFDAWFHIVEGFKLTIWQMAFLASVWRIWRIEIMIIFQHETFDKDWFFELCTSIWPVD